MYPAEKPEIDMLADAKERSQDDDADRKISSERKTRLTPEEKLRAATCKIMYGTTDAEIALILGVTNDGRVNEAVKDLLSHVGLGSPGYKQRDRSPKESF